MAFDLSKFIGKFVEEARDHISDINRFLLDYEKNPDDNELLNQVFRSAHTIKGSSRILKLIPISNVAHKLEDGLDALRNDKILPSKELLSLFFKAVDLITEMVDQVQEGKTIDLDTSQLCKNLEQAVSGKIAPPSSSKANPEAALSKIKSPGKKNTPAEPHNQNHTENISDPKTVPVTAPPGSEQKPAEPILPQETIKIPAQKLDDSIKMMGEILSHHSQMKQTLTDLEEIQRISKKFLDWSVQQENNNAFLENNGNEKNLSKNEFSAAAPLLHSKIKEYFLNMRDAMNIHGLLTENLRDKVLQLRMLPLSTAMDAFPRLVRDLSGSSGKEVDFIVEGSETELDKRVIEKIGDPLLHMIQNSIDHGIEPPEERIKKGKPRHGTLKIIAGYEGGNVLIEISDDGGGLPIEKIKLKSLQRKLISEDELEKLSEPEIANLIFEPGFSTSPIITDISGRGVGMDVVKKNIVEHLKGSIQTETVAHEGTRFFIRVPLTLAVMRVLMFSVSGMLFAFPISSVREILRAPRSEIIDVVNKKALRLREQIIPIVEMKNLFDLPETAHKIKKEVIVLFLAMGNEMVGVVIDHLISEEDMEIKPLPAHMKKIDLVSGAIITGKGDVVILLHAPKILEYSKNIQESPSIKPTGSDDKKIQHILVVEDSVSTRDIEKSILESYGYKVDIASDGIEGWEKTRKIRYDLIITDIEMPRMNGFALTEKLRQEENYQHVPIIIVSSRDQEEDKRKGIQVGADAYIVKGGFEQSNLLSTIQSLI